ncbi:uncharacterized protein LOC121404367 [Drosophila obscura]|uniref:uncharacterized protein LOC121404367 n=1 Tax=Drosophila obscura TaxID=7282 RepID=UPI001BB2C04E|nr:uncharacterized protein LOC121404367 [Drosophila obscura]
MDQPCTSNGGSYVEQREQKRIPTLCTQGCMPQDGVLRRRAKNPFVGRRGPLVKLYCDNTTNFVGAARMLKERVEGMDAKDEALNAYAAAHRFSVEFIPPRAPHIGGLWESAVKSAKHLQLRAMGNAVLKEVLLVEVEAVLNSRPLVVDSGSPNDGEVLTPAHLLVGRMLVSLPPELGLPRLDNSLSYLQRWQLVSAIKQKFWKDWSRDYLLSLQQRGNLSEEVANLEPGRVVAIHEDNVPPQMWLIGAVEEAIPEADGNVHVAVVRTKAGIYKRSIHRLAPIPTD